MNFKTFALATAAVVGISGAASAATLSVNGGVGPIVFNAPGSNYGSDCSGGSTHCYDPNGAVAAGLTETLQGFFSAATYPGLEISGPATIRVTFLGKEAGAKNAAMSGPSGSISNTDTVGSSFTAMVGGPGVLDFTFEVLAGAGGAPTGAKAGSGGFVGSAAIAFSAVFNGGQSVYAFFDDSGASNNRDWDDMVVRIDVIPVPAAGLLLLGGLGAMAAMKRRRKAA